MGWTESFIEWNRKDTYKDLLLRAYPSMKKYIEEGTRKLSQKGNTVYVLDKNKEGVWYVVCYLCQKNRKGGFFTKDIDAINNDCFDFPKSWLKLLDKNDENVKRYITSRTKWEEEQKSKTKYEIGDYLRCVANNTISWSGGYKIKANEVFYIHITNKSRFNGKRKIKQYQICEPDGYFGMADRLRRIDGKSFKSDYWIKSAEKISKEEIDRLVTEYRQKRL